MTEKSERKFKEGMLRNFLMQPETYGLASGEKVQLIETHASFVFLAGDRALKMKKPVCYSFLDFSTLEKRQATIARELELNKRTAPEIYLDMIPVMQMEGGGFQLGRNAEDGAGKPVEWLLSMKRFPDEGLLAKQAEKGTLRLSLVTELAEKISTFHRQAEVHRNAGGKERIAEILADNETDMQPFAGHIFDADRLAYVHARSKALLAKHEGLIETRREEGYMRHCHGDLHLGNVTEIEGHPVIFDCIEFNDRFARTDVLYDLAFLLMDLAFRADKDERLRGFATHVLNAWLDHLPQAEMVDTYEALALLPLYMATRAMVRAKVTAMQLVGHKDADVLAQLARSYLDFAQKLLEPSEPWLIAVGGFSGTGKSTLAKALSAVEECSIGMAYLRSDVIRKKLAGVGPLERLPQESYTVASSIRVYDELMQFAHVSLKAGMSVIVDAVFARADERDEAERLARECGVDFLGLWLAAPADVLEARVAHREREGRDPSDAGVAVLHRQLGYDTGRIRWAVIDASGTPQEALVGAKEQLEKVKGKKSGTSPLA